jgi:peptide/nickel transport system substrate-binding protein
MTLLYDTLTWKNEKGIIPWVARQWKVSDDARDVEFAIEPGFNWHDGRPLTAADVAFSFDYYSRFPYRWMSTTVIESARAVGGDIVRIRLKEPYAPFIEDIAGVVPIVPKHVWEKVDNPLHYEGADTFVGSGPFRLAEYRSAQGTYRLEANAGYKPGRVFVREFQLLNLPNEARLPALMQGQLEITRGLDLAAVDAVMSKSTVKVLESQPFSITRLSFNTARAPFDRVEVRQAVAHAIDRAKIAELVTKAPPIVGSAGVVPPGSPWATEGLRQYAFDPQQARNLLRGEKLTIDLITDPALREAELMQPMLEQVGITLNIRKLDAKSRTPLLREGSFQATLLMHIGVGGDPDYLRRWYVGEEGNDFTQGNVFKHADYERLARQQSATIDPVQRKTLVAKMQAILADELPTVVLFHRPFYWLYDSAKYTPMNTWGGLLNGVPHGHNKLTFLAR